MASSSAFSWVLIAVIAILTDAWGGVRVARVAVVVVALAWAAEAFGVATGFPFGAYRYTAVLQPQVAYVPLLFCWLMLLPLAWAVAEAIVGHVWPLPCGCRLWPWPLLPGIFSS